MKQRKPDEYGTVYTFYSYKGGVGRSMALANVAALLAKWGKSVLVVDWDLEAPGIERYFSLPSYRLSASRSTTPGLVDLIHAYVVANKEIDWHKYLLQASPFDQTYAVSILTAGQDTPDYVSRVRSLEWESLFEKRQLGFYLERLREEWIKEFDFVLIDSRTGITDIGGICTIHLPDMLVLFFTTNRQSLDGVIDVMNRARQARTELPFDRSYLVGIPVPARDESRTEYQSALDWRKNIFAKELAEFYQDWLPEEKTPEDALEVLRLPYIPFWSFGERLPVIEEGTTAPESLGAAYERLAKLIFNRLQWEDVLAGPVEKPAETTRIETPPQVWNVPYPRNPLCVNREKVLEQLHDALTSRQVVALSGLGGIGKTQTAIEYAYHYRDEYTAVLWAKSDAREALISSFVAIAELLILPEKTTQNQTTTIAAVKHWLETNTKWLLILDDVDDLVVAREFLPSSRKGHVVLTTRVHTTGTIAERIEVDNLEVKDGALFLLRRAKILALDAPLYLASIDDQTKAEAIVKELGGLPLALDQAGAFVLETPSSLTEYLTLYKQEGTKLLAQRGELSLDNHPPVTVTFSIVFQQVEMKSKTAADLIRACAFLAPDAIPEEIFTEGGKELGGNLAPLASQPIDFLNALKEAGRFSLLDRNPETRTLNIHRLVQQVVKEAMNDETQRLWTERTVRAVNRAFPDVEFSTWPLCERLLPHAQACASLIEKWKLEFPEAARLLNKTGRYLYERARYNEAEPLLQQALTIGEPTLVPCLASSLAV
jgi:cellulose biosynthesis protein BcsQ